MLLLVIGSCTKFKKRIFFATHAGLHFEHLMRVPLIIAGRSSHLDIAMLHILTNGLCGHKLVIYKSENAQKI